MGKKVTIDYSYVFPFINDEKIESYKGEALKALKKLIDGDGLGNDFIGWRELPEVMKKSEELNKIIEVAKNINKNGDLLICVGIGGSYLGAKAVIEALLPIFYNNLPKKDRKGPKIYFAGNNISGSYLEAILEEINRSESVYVNVISKSGTTTEPGIAFRNIKQKMEKKYGKIGANERIIATTDAKKGALKTMASNEGYKTFIIPDDVGGRFSVLTPVGLLPMAALGLDIIKLLDGAISVMNITKEETLEKNPALLYAVVRNLLLKTGYNIEMLVNYDPELHFFSEWWKQLYGESEGKNGKGLFVASCDFTTDLHSMGQWIQDGQRIIFETTLNIEEPLSILKVASDKDDLDGLEYLANEPYSEINKRAEHGTLLAHYEGKVPNIIFNIPSLNEYYMGQLIYIFEQACGISGYLLGVNPFDQPGVEAYKKNMFALLGKAGSEKDRLELDNKIKTLPSGKKTI